jgi:hypothetical protein
MRGIPSRLKTACKKLLIKGIEQFDDEERECSLRTHCL